MTLNIVFSLVDDDTECAEKKKKVLAKTLNKDGTVGRYHKNEKRMSSNALETPCSLGRRKKNVRG